MLIRWWKKSHDQSSGRVGSNLTAAAAVSPYPVAQWWVHSPPTNSRGPGSLKSRLRWHIIWVEFCYWFSSLLRGVFSGFSGFPSCQKQTFSKFQFDQESGRRRTTTIKSLNIYLFISLSSKSSNYQFWTGVNNSEGATSVFSCQGVFGAN